ncbi:hypothetical protein ACFL0M_14705 [Thermodesulfobacteriota bacterium]
MNGKSHPATDFTKLPIDLILFNGKVITVDEDFRIAAAIAIGHGRILHVGRNQEIKSLAVKSVKIPASQMVFSTRPSRV